METKDSKGTVPDILTDEKPINWLIKFLDGQSGK